MTNQIVNVNISQVQAPLPNTLQSTGAFASQGATTLAAQARQYLTQPSDLTPILKGALALSSITWTTNVATAATTAPHGFPMSSTIELTISGATPSTYNGTFLCTITGTSAFTYPLPSDPGGSTSVPGVYTPEDVAELVAMVTTFFAQGSAIGVYVLELGPGVADAGVTALTTWLTNNPKTIYIFVVPRYWDGNTSFKALAATFESPTAEQYFFVTTTTGTYTGYSNLLKPILAGIEAAGIPATEFDMAAFLYVALSRAPSTTNQVPQFQFSFIFGVTPYPLPGNQALFTALRAAGISWVGTGAEGGISNTLIMVGKLLDKRPWNYWYSIDWANITVDLDLSNEVINGSNNKLAPLIYNQQGVNRLQARAQGTMARGISFGLLLGPITVDAVPFNTYVAQNESDFRLGVYNGLSVTFTPNQGFESITIDFVVTDFPTGA